MRGIWPFSHGKIWVDAVTRIPSNTVDNDLARTQVCLEIDSHGFDWQIFLVSASGFLTDSYALFATNVVLPSLAYLYWPEATDGRPERIINCVTLGGCMAGQFLSGFLADKFGRRRLYGIELGIVIFSTLGMAQASTGEYHSMNVLGWIYFWRFFIGLGIGAEYPLTAVITAEFTDVNRRARMLAAVFLMQPIGQVLAAGVGWAVLYSLGSSDELQNFPISPPKDLTEAQRIIIISTIDKTWRCVIGVGAAPALLAILFRATIPESPRYTIDVIQDGKRAVSDIRRYHDRDYSHTGVMADIGIRGVGLQADGHAMTNGGTAGNGQASTANTAPTNEPPSYFTLEEIKRYLWREGNWRYLAATSLCWFLLDFAFYGLGINNPRQLAAIWAPPPSNSSDPYATSGATDWQNPYDLKANFFTELYFDAKQYIITISLGSTLGSVFLIGLIDKIRRKTWLIVSFLILAVGFALTAATLQAVEFHDAHWLTVVLYSLNQFLFNFGPNSLTFIIPAEIFPTRYRCTGHGISAAMGKLGSIAVQLLLSRDEFGSNPGRLGLVLGIFSIVMALGALIAWVWLPDVQHGPVGNAQETSWPILPSKSLELLAKGRAHAILPPPTGEGQIISLRGKIKAASRGIFARRVIPDSPHEFHSIT